jgi:phage gpG-like protein
MSGVRVNFNRIKQVKRTLNKSASTFVRAMGLETERYVKQSFVSSPSPAGGPPGIDTGALRASIHVEMTDALTAMVSDGVAYGVYLEFGTSRMAARPFMMPALVWVSREAQRIARDIKWT